jgi:hypothetical protein
MPRLGAGFGACWSAAALRPRRSTAPYRPACQLADRALGRAAAGRFEMREARRSRATPGARPIRVTVAGPPARLAKGSQISLLCAKHEGCGPARGAYDAPFCERRGAFGRRRSRAKSPSPVAAGGLPKTGARGRHKRGWGRGGDTGMGTQVDLCGRASRPWPQNIQPALSST